jgi:hypothetical protein
MTLIIAAATNDTQIMVSDRQLTDSLGQDREQDAYKIFTYMNLVQHYSFAVAFTGLAELGRQSTLDWLMETLPRVMNAETDLGLAINNFTLECSRKFSTLITHLGDIHR